MAFRPQKILNYKCKKELQENVNTKETVQNENYQEIKRQTKWPLYSINSEGPGKIGIEESRSNSNWNLYDILNKIKQSLSSTVVQVVKANLPDPPNPYWTNIVTGVACLTETNDNKCFIQVYDMEILELGWETEIFPGLEYHELKCDEPFHVLKDNNDTTGLIFMDPIDAKHFYESAMVCMGKIHDDAKYIQMKIQAPDVDTLQHVSGIQRKAGQSIYEIVNHLSEVEDPKLRKIFARPFKSKNDAQLCIEKIRTQTRKHSLTMVEKGTLHELISKIDGTEKRKRNKRLLEMKQSIGSPEMDSFQLVQSVSSRHKIDNTDQLPPVARKMFRNEANEN